MFLRYFMAIQLFGLNLLLATNLHEYAEPQFGKSRNIPKLNLSLPELPKALSDEDVSLIKELPTDEKKKRGLNEGAIDFTPSWLKKTSENSSNNQPKQNSTDDTSSQETPSSRPRSKRGPTFEELKQELKRYLPPYERKKTHTSDVTSEDLHISDDSSSGDDDDKQPLQPIYPRDRIFVSQVVTRIEFGTMMDSVPDKPKRGRCPLPLAPKKQ